VRQETKVMSAYLDELEAAYGSTEESAEWIEWVRKFINRMDPLHSPPTMPEEPEITREDLKPFLPNGVSPTALIAGHSRSRWPLTSPEAAKSKSVG
jgi:hypothetical protein